LSGDVCSLREIVARMQKGERYEEEELFEAVNQVITHSNVINCVFNKDDPDFSDMSDLEVEHLET
jgi:hypothetical protein